MVATTNRRNTNNEDLETIMSRFHKDFRNRSEKMLDFMEFRHNLLMDQAKRSKLSSVSNVSTTNISNVQNVQQTSKSIAKTISQSMMSEDGGQSKQLKELTEVSKEGISKSEKQHKESKSIFKSSLFQMRMVDKGIEFMSSLVSGPSDTMRVVNAVNNVENAILGQQRVALDERSILQKVVEGEEGVLAMFPKIEAAMNGMNIDASKIEESIGSAFHMFTGFAKKGVGAIKDTAGNVFDKMTDGATAKGAMKKAEGAGSSIASAIISMFAKTSSGIVESELVKSKYTSFLSAFLFGDLQSMLTTSAVIKPIEMIKGTFWSIKKGADLIVNHPLHQTLPLLAHQFGIAGAAIAIVGKTLKPFVATTSFINSIPDRLSKRLKKGKSVVSEKFSGLMGTIRDKLDEWKKPFKKKMGKAMLGMGAWLGLKGVTMLGIMGTIMTIGMAAMPFIIKGIIISAIVGAGALVYKNWDKITASLNENIVTPFVGWFTSISETVSAKIQSVKETVKNAFSSIFDFLKQAIVSGIKKLPFGEKIASSFVGDGEGTAKDISGSVAPSTNLDKVIDNRTKAQTEEMNNLQKKQLQTNERMLKVMEKIEQKETPTPLPSRDIDDNKTSEIVK